MSTIVEIPPGKGMEWWSKLTAEQKKEAVRPHVEAKRSNRAIQALLGLETTGPVANQRHKINHEDIDYVPRQTKKQAPLPRGEQGAESPPSLFPTRLGQPQRPALTVTTNADHQPLWRLREEANEAEVARRILERWCGIWNPSPRQRPFFRLNSTTRQEIRECAEIYLERYR